MINGPEISVREPEGIGYTEARTMYTVMLVCADGSRSVYERIRKCVADGPIEAWVAGIAKRRGWLYLGELQRK